VRTCGPLGVFAAQEVHAETRKRGNGGNEVSELSELSDVSES
jgi:hypothetical protein